ncbi:MAG: 16S rRNA (cytosine(1402)-N(4))-methyltransferase RsmH [Ruminococcaceae bacterium]|nr:16S rRNA (cytosine(1402)-N(4))-methyltransferase RsmH [Oscillospiraceae bacterium]
MEFSHISVLLNESINALNIKENGIYVDGTAGGGGHSFHIASSLKSGRLIALDRDPDAIKAAGERLKGLPAEVVQSNFKDFDKVLDDKGIELIDGMLLDLGVSSHQLDEGERGFSYHTDAPLDMRMAQSGTTAADLVNNLSVEQLSDILTRYGEEKFSFRIAKAIERERNIAPIETTVRLAEIISAAVPAAARRDGHPARKSFQAIRIAVNGELDALQEVLKKAFYRLNIGGILAVITFHSLEDRMVKQAFAELTKGCTCPSDFPVCVCGKTPDGKLVPKKPIIPSDDEIKNNPRSRSAKLRVIERIK